MSDSLLLQIFRQLTPRDRRAVCSWTRCDYYNRREEVVLLCEYLAAIKSSADCTSERLFAAAFPDKPYDHARLRYTMSYLLDLVRRYLALTEWESNPSAPALYLVRSLRKRGIDALFEREWQDAMTKLEEQPLRDAHYHLQRYQLLQEQIELSTSRQRSARINLQPLPDELTLFFIPDMLRHASLALSHQATSGQAYQFLLLDAALKSVEFEPVLQAPAVAVYYHAYKALQSDDKAHFEQLKTMLAEHAGRFQPTELRSLYLLAINACIRRMNAGQKAYIREAFDLYRETIARNLLTENGHISGFTYKNIIRIGVALEELDWTEQFIEQYRLVLHPRERDNIYRYNRAYLFFQQQDYNRAMPLLQQVDLEDTLNNLDARRMLLRSYFELQEWDALDSLLQSFGAYLRRQKTLGYHRQTNEKLIYFTKKLLDVRAGNKSMKKQIRAELEATTDVAERNWLLLQV
jgi:hypothetical protein